MNGAEIRAARKALGLTQTELAVRAGIKQGYLSEIEKGTAVPRIETLQSIAAALGLRLVITFQPGTATSAA